MTEFKDEDVYDEDNQAASDAYQEEEVPNTELLQDEQYEDFYQKLRKKIKKWLDSKSSKGNKWTEYLVAAPDLFYLLVKLVLDKKVEPTLKVKLIFALTYFISPFDLIPEAFLGVIGYIDDVALAAYVLNDLMNKTDEKLIRKYWLGEGDVLSLIRRILSSADDMLGSGLYKKLIDALKK